MDNTQRQNRDLPLDLVKGILVIVMVIYHAMRYFSTASQEAYGYIRFVTGSFIFISGYIVSRFYETEYRKDRAGISEQLVVRGVKLLIIFTVLNVLINLTGIGDPTKAPHSLQHYLNNLNVIYISGDPRTAFTILLTISYVLMISPVVLFFSKFKTFLLITNLLIALWFSLFEIYSYHLYLGMVGLLGLSVGIVISGSEHVILIKNKGIIFCCLLICISLMGHFHSIITYSIGIMIVLKLFYDLAQSVNLETPINRVAILFGQYTLVCYIMQIAFLQGLSWMVSRQKWGLGYQVVVIFVLTDVFLLALCLLLTFLRDRYRFMDESYRFIFSQRCAAKGGPVARNGLAGKTE